MTTDDVAEVDGRPEIFPLPYEDYAQFATAGKEVFGWSGHAQEFRVSRYRWSGGLQPIETWPLTEDGWGAAWRHLNKELPGLAAAVRVAGERSAVRRNTQLRLAEDRAALEGEGVLERLAGCVFLGGYGAEAGLKPGERVDLFFTQQGVWLAKAGGFKPFLRRSYVASYGLEFEGGAVQSGGGYRGGGFGLLGAAEGMAMASLLNSLTSKTSIHTAVRFEAEGAEIFLFTDQAVPRTLEMRFAEVRGRIKAASQQSIPRDGQSSADFTECLVRLSELLEKGHLTEEEFATAKARLLSEA